MTLILLTVTGCISDPVVHQSEPVAEETHTELCQKYVNVSLGAYYLGYESLTEDFNYEDILEKVNEKRPNLRHVHEVAVTMAKAAYDAGYMVKNESLDNSVGKSAVRKVLTNYCESNLNAAIIADTQVEAATTYSTPTPTYSRPTRIIQTDAVGNKLYNLPQYTITPSGRVYQTDSVGNIRYDLPSYIVK
jgi:hypothetical protein